MVKNHGHTIWLISVGWLVRRAVENIAQRSKGQAIGESSQDARTGRGEKTIDRGRGVVGVVVAIVVVGGGWGGVSIVRWWWWWRGGWEWCHVVVVVAVVVVATVCVCVFRGSWSGLLRTSRSRMWYQHDKQHTASIFTKCAG